MKAFLRFCLTKVRQSPMLKHRLLYFVYGCIGVVTGSGTTWYFDTVATPPTPINSEECTVVAPPEEPIRTMPSEQDRYRALLQQYQSGEL
jgi:hypothetical protein